MTTIRSILFLGILLLVNSISLLSQVASELEEQLASSEDTDRLSILNELSTSYLNSSIDTSLLYAYESLRMAKNMGVDSFILEAHFQLFQAFNFSGQGDSTLFHASKANEIAEKINDPSLVAKTYKCIATAYGRLANNEQKIEYNLKAIKYYKTLLDTFQLASVYYNTARAYKKTGHHELGINFALKAKDHFTSLQNEVGQGLAASIIAEIYDDLGQKEKVVSYLEEAKKTIGSNSPYYYANVLSQYGYFYLKQSKLDSAQHYFSDCLSIAKKTGSPFEMAKSHDSLGEVFLQKNKPDSSYYHLNIAKNILLDLDKKEGLAYTYKNLGTYYEQIGHVDSTSYYYMKSLETAKAIHLSRVEEEVLLKLVHFNEKTGHNQKALAYHKQYFGLINKTKGLETEKAIAALETKYETEKKEREIERLELLSIADASKNNTLKIGLWGSLLVFGLLIAGLLYRRKNEQKLYALKQQMHEQEKKELDKELSYKTKQLTSHALHMVQKNKVLQELKQGITEISKSSDSTNKKALRALIRRIDFNIQSDEDWNTFKLYFEQTNKNFYENLARINNELTSTELKLCSLIKLNMNIKETASVLNIEPTSVKTARHRLRKKLNLQQGQDLVAFIRQVA